MLVQHTLERVCFTRLRLVRGRVRTSVFFKRAIARPVSSNQAQAEQMNFFRLEWKKVRHWFF